MSPRPRCFALLAVLLLGSSCASSVEDAATRGDSTRARAITASDSDLPFPGARLADELIDPGERHFAHLWMLTQEGENAEAYWNSAGDGLVFQRRASALGIACDRIFVLQTGAREPLQVSNGQGVTTCGYFLPGDRSVLFASTHADQRECPPPIDPAEYRRLGYFWRVFPEYELWRSDLETGELVRLTDSPGYDAEATVSPRGHRIVFTSSRSGDLELWTCDLEGKDLRQVTDSPGYDGGAFFSHDGTKLVFRSQVFDPAKPAEDRAFHAELLKQWKVNPKRMELQLANADGSGRRAIRELGGANFAPYFFPDDRRVIFSSNHHDPAETKREFDLFAIGVDGEGLERITTAQGFDSFPMFSPDGRYLVFASNRGARVQGDTNLFLAEWR